MNTDIKTQWIAALRSGAYQQGRGRLRAGNEFCCLGVLCDLHRKAVGGAWDITSERYHNDPHGLPPVVQVWADLERYPLINGRDITIYNDGQSAPDEMHPHTFTEIADLIEQHL